MAQGPRDFIDPNKHFSDSLHFMENSFLSFLQALFYNFPPSANSYHYDDDESLTEIKIEGQNTDNLKAVDTRPKIVVARGAVSINKSGIGNFVGSQNLSAMSRKTATIREGTVGISCYSRSDMEADRLAEICADAIESLTPLIRSLGFLEVRATQIGQRAMIKAGATPQLFVTPLLIRAQITKNYTAEIVDPVKLRAIIYQWIIKPVNLRIPPSV